MNISKLILIRRIMLVLNIGIISVICYVYVTAASLIVSTGSSREFLRRASFVPLSADNMVLMCALLLLALIMNVTLRENFMSSQKGLPLLFSCLLDIVFCVWIIYITSFNYRGILLMAVSYILLHTENKKRKLMLVCVFISFYFVCQYELASQFLNIVSINAYIEYLDPSSRSVVYMLKNILYSCNDVLFVIFMVYWIQLQKDETSQLNELYEQQYRTNEELKLANIQLKHYISQSEETVKTRERNRLAREIHDTIGHSLTAISAGLDACRELIQIDRRQLEDHLAGISEIAREVLLEVRRSVKHLRLDTLGDLTLNQAILKLAADISNVTNTRVNYHYSGNGSLSPAEESVLYRTVQESITNSVRHGKATLVEIHLDIKPECACLTIEDNGSGCARIVPGTGLAGMYERAAELNGEISFTSDGCFKTQLILPRGDGSCD